MPSESSRPLGSPTYQQVFQRPIVRHLPAGHVRGTPMVIWDAVREDGRAETQVLFDPFAGVSE